MSTFRLIHITPELPPTVGGIADYTAILTQRLVEVSDEAVEPVLVRAGKASGTPPEVDFRCVDHGGAYSAEALGATIEQLASGASRPAMVLLQYSGYGYAPRGAPLWLLRALQQACWEGGMPLITMFHELYATGPPWTSAFWLSPVQRYVAAQLARLSSAVVTNRGKSATWLRRYVPAETPLRVQPVFSNVGEPEHVPPWGERESYAVVFGGTGKNALYSQYGEQVARVLDLLEVTELVDIGPKPDNSLLESIGRDRVIVKGFLSVQEIQGYLKNAKAGFVCRNPEAFTKSGSLAAYAAHGIPTFIGLRDSNNASQLWKDGIHYHTLQTEENGDERGPHVDFSVGVGANAYELYKASAHSTKAGNVFYQIISEVCAA